MIFLIRVSRYDKDRLEKAGLLKHKSKDQDPNFYVANREHTGRDKSYYVVENYDIMLFLGLIEAKKTKRFNRKPNSPR